MSIKQPECVGVGLVIHYGLRIRYIVMWPAPLYNIFPHFLIKGMILERIY
jgi:hypothetical protein